MAWAGGETCEGTAGADCALGARDGYVPRASRRIANPRFDLIERLRNFVQNAPEVRAHRSGHIRGFACPGRGLPKGR